MPHSIRLPRDAQHRVLRRTAVVSGISAVASVLLSEAIMLLISRGLDFQGAFAAFVLPLMIGTPTLYVLMRRGEQLRHVNEQLEVLAATDALTGALNRRAFSAAVAGVLEQASARPAVFMLVDADHFKLVNDRFGHECGDRALELIVAALRAAAGTDAVVGRLGGEEFGVLVADCDAADAIAMADALRDAVRAIVLEGGSITHPLSISVGCVIAMPGEATDFSRLYREADRSLYAAKSAGRDRAVVSRAVANRDQRAA